MLPITAPILAIDPVTPRSRLLRIDVGRHAFRYLPGQAITLGAPDQPERKPYSIACSPERASETGQLELLVALDESGTLGPHLPGVRIGSMVEVEGPVGTFVFPEGVPQQQLLFVAGGTGIAPLRAMIDHALRRHQQLRLSLLYSARRGDEFAFIDELRGHARGRRMQLHETVTRDAAWGGSRGRIARSHFEAVLHDPASTLAFVCGPPPLVAASATTLTELGVPQELVRTEQWGGET